jgi:hypothetical protein
LASFELQFVFPEAGSMKRDFIFDIYRKVREERDKELERIFKMLRPKAVSDPEIQEAIRLLEAWSRKSIENDAKTNGDTKRPRSNNGGPL